jgi:predicted phage terminase large subunit-like protein
MMQLSPQTDDTAYFDISRINRYKVNERPKTQAMNIVCAWDLAIGTKQYNDHTVGVALGIDHKRRVWVLDRMRGKWGDIRIIIDMIIDMHLRWNASITGVEKMMVEKVMGPLLQTRMQERNEFINIAQGKEALTPITDKAARARTLQGIINNGNLYVPEGETWDEYVNILSRFLVSNIDDDTDASAWGAILLNRTAPPTDPREENKRKRKEEDLWMHDLEDFVNNYSRAAYMES